MARGHLADRYRNFRYLVEIDGVPRAAFGYCMGLDAAHAPIEYYISDDEVDLLDVAESNSSAHLILAQGIAFDDALDAWRRASAAGHPERHDGTIIEYDGMGHARHVYHFHGAWPAVYQGVMARGGDVERHIDTLDLVYDSLTRN